MPPSPGPFSCPLWPGQLCLQTPCRARGGGREGECVCPPALSFPQALKDLKGRTEAVPCVVGDEEVWTSDVRYQVSVSLVGGRGERHLPESGVRPSGSRQAHSTGSLPPKPGFEFRVPTAHLPSHLGSIVIKCANVTPARGQCQQWLPHASPSL